MGVGAPAAAVLFESVAELILLALSLVLAIDPEVNPEFRIGLKLKLEVPVVAGNRGAGDVDLWSGAVANVSDEPLELDNDIVVL